MFTKLCRVGKDPVLRFMPDGSPCLNVSLAYDYGKKGDDGKRPTQWLDAVSWGKQAETLSSFLRKGASVVATIDDIHIKTYKEKDGGDGYKLAGKIVSIDFVGRSGDKPVEHEKKEPEKHPQQNYDSSFDDLDRPF